MGYVKFGNPDASLNSRLIIPDWQHIGSSINHTPLNICYNDSNVFSIKEIRGKLKHLRKVYLV